jgi:hypothetical protein
LLAELFLPFGFPSNNRLASAQFMSYTTSEDTQPSKPLSESSLLWARIMHKPVQAQTALPQASELMPQEKAKASTRILLHDTQARLEEFSRKADTLVKEVADSRRELTRSREEMAVQMERVSDDVAQLGTSLACAYMRIQRSFFLIQVV